MKKPPSIIVPIITPFDKNGRVYEQGIKNLIDFLNEKGIRGIWVLGSYGAFPLLEKEERMKMAEITLSLAQKKGIYTVIQIGSSQLETAERLCRHAQDNGADAVASTVPFYYASAHYTENNFIVYFSKLMDCLNVPLFFYNNPKTTGYTPTIQFIQELLDIGIYGIKDTTTDILAISEKIMCFQSNKSDNFYMGGSASVLLTSRIMGAHGVVCGSGVAMPEIVLKLDKAIESQNISQAAMIQHQLIKARTIQGRYVGRSVACYDILNARGVNVGSCKLPWLSMTDTQTKEVMKDLKDLSLWS